MNKSSHLQRGAVFTKPIVADFMLDLVGYRANAALTSFSILEPSFGSGGFLIPIVKRLLKAFKKLGSTVDAVSTLCNCIRGVELHQQTYQTTTKQILELLVKFGLTEHDATKLTNSWLRQGDFLLSPFDTSFSHIVGNPPYMRQELLPPSLIQAYRSRFQTIYGRADIYIPFIEYALSLLKDHGELCFICSNRWLKNRYGKLLRKLIADKYHLKHYIDMAATAAFKNEVMAYTSIMTLSKQKKSFTFVAKQPSLDTDNLNLLARHLNNSNLDTFQHYKNHLGQGNCIEVVPKTTCGSDSWLIDCISQLKLIRKLEQNFLLLEKAGCKVGIGVATGNDKVFIKNYHELDIEEDRKLPLAMSRDTVSGNFQWGGKGIINTFTAEGKIISLSDYPKLATYLETNRVALTARYIARNNPAYWYRTTDLIHSELTCKPKLLIPDIKKGPTVVFDEGTAYPHHNLYWITSKSWDPRALRSILRSNVAKLFVWAYSVKMRDGWLRFQAQNLRRIVIPSWESVPPDIRKQLIAINDSMDLALINFQVYELFGLNKDDIVIIEEINSY